MPTVKEKLVSLNTVVMPHEAISFKDGKLTCQLQVGHPTEADAIVGCYSTHLMEAVIAIQKHYNDILPSRENSIVITKLEEAWLWLKKRELDRKERGVLQTDKK